MSPVDELRAELGGEGPRGDASEVRLGGVWICPRHARFNAERGQRHDTQAAGFPGVQAKTKGARARRQDKKRGAGSDASSIPAMRVTLRTTSAMSESSST